MSRLAPIRPVLGLALALAATGCIDPKGKFDQFTNRAGTADASTIDGPVGMIFDVSGTFLYAADPPIQPDMGDVVQFIATYHLTQTGATATLTASMTALTVAEPRTTVGDPLVDNTIDVAADGTFTAQFDGLVPGAANPVTFSDAAITSMSRSTIVSADLICGTLTGTVAGIDIAGATFASIRVSDTGNLPAPLTHCPAPQETDAGVDAGTDAPTDAPPDA